MKTISLNNISKSYGNVKALDNISFSLEENGFYALLGENGAGKSTTVDILSTLLKPDSGSGNIFEYTLGKDNDKIRSIISVVFQNFMLDNYLTVRENLDIRGSLYIKNKNDLNKKIDEITEILEIRDIMEKRYMDLSGGEKRRSDIAKALIPSPKILFLDEPTTGLDPSIRANLWNTINDIKDNSNLTILLTTHYLDEAENSDKVIILKEGIIIKEDTPKNLRKEYGQKTISFNSDESIKNYLESNNIKYSKNNGNYKLFIEEKYIIEILYPIRNEIYNLEIREKSLEDIFIKLLKEKKK